MIGALRVVTLDREERRDVAVDRCDVAGLQAHSRRAVAYAVGIAEEVREAGDDRVADGRVVDGEGADVGRW